MTTEEEDGDDEDGRELDILEWGEVTGGKWWLSVETVAADEAKNFLRCSATVEVDVVVEFADDVVVEEIMAWSSDSELERPDAFPAAIPIPIVRLDRPLPGDVLLLMTPAAAPAPPAEAIVVVEATVPTESTWSTAVGIAGVGEWGPPPPLLRGSDAATDNGGDGAVTVLLLLLVVVASVVMECWSIWWLLLLLMDLLAPNPAFSEESRSESGG